MNNLSLHIDAPIKKCVVGLNLLGIPTLMSCCGYTYKGEEVPKKHLEKAYIFIDILKVDRLSRLDLIEIALSSGWIMAPYHQGRIIDFYPKLWDKDHPWNDKDCPHFHEMANIAIAQLAFCIDKYKDRFCAAALITDGNQMYIDAKIKYWQYEPAAPWIVTPEIYNGL